MLDHVSITVSDIAAAERFYDAIMKALGVVKVGRRDDWLGYGERARPAYPDRVYLSIRKGAKPEEALRPPLVLQGEVADPGRRVLGCRHCGRRQRRRPTGPARAITRPTTPRSSGIPTATGSRRSAIIRCEDRPHDGAGTSSQM